MPMYCWRCESCGAGREVVRSVAECMRPEKCECGAPMGRELTAPHVRPDIAPYQAVAGDSAGKWISSRREHQEFLKRNNLIEVGTEKPKDTSKMRGIGVDRRELREQMRQAIRETCKPDAKRGGLIERTVKRGA